MNYLDWCNIIEEFERGFALVMCSAPLEDVPRSFQLDRLDSVG